MAVATASSAVDMASSAVDEAIVTASLALERAGPRPSRTGSATATRDPGNHRAARPGDVIARVPARAAGIGAPTAFLPRVWAAGATKAEATAMSRAQRKRERIMVLVVMDN